jgi:hypothetical protein
MSKMVTNRRSTLADPEIYSRIKDNEKIGGVIDRVILFLIFAPHQEPGIPVQTEILR